MGTNKCSYEYVYVFVVIIAFSIIVMTTKEW
jgi:hypothetical protein